MCRGTIHLSWMSDEIAILSLDNPSARNAMSISMMQQLQLHVQKLCEHKTRVVIVTAEGQAAFCAGGDLQDVREHLIEKEQAKNMNSNMTHVLSSFSEHNIFVIVALNGPALGGGAELTTYGDVVIAEPHAYIGFVHTKLGVSPGWGGGMRLLEKVGRHRGRQILVCAQKIMPAKALLLGLIDEEVEIGCALQKAKELANNIVQSPQESVYSVQRFFNNPTNAHETEIFLSLWGESAHRHALGMTSPSDEI